MGSKPRKSKGKAKPAQKRAHNKPKKRAVAKAGAARSRAIRLAAGVVAGQSVTSLADQEGLSRPHTSKLVNGAEVRHIITDLVNSDLDTVQRCWAKLLREIEDTLDNGDAFAVSKVKDENGSVFAQPVRIGPDRYARMAAGKVFLQAVCAGRAAPKPVDPKDLVPKLTLEQLDALLAAAAAEGTQPGDCNLEPEDRA